MTNKPSKNVSRLRRHARVRAKISGTAEKPRLCLYRSNKNIEVQLIDDVKGVTLVASSSVALKLENGSNIEAAKLSGVNVASTTTKAYVVSAFCASIVGLITCAQAGMGAMDAGNGYEMYAVAASVIGGISTLGGQGILLGNIVGASVWGSMYNGLSLVGAPVAWRNIIVGVIVVLSVLIDVVIRGESVTKSRGKSIFKKQQS